MRVHYRFTTALEGFLAVLISCLFRESCVSIHRYGIIDKLLMIGVDIAILIYVITDFDPLYFDIADPMQTD